VLHHYQLYYTTRHPLPTAFLIILIEIEPICFTNVAADPRWKVAMAIEFDALISDGNWTLCPRPLQ
jgi:hypothetical protein